MIRSFKTMMVRGESLLSKQEDLFIRSIPSSVHVHRMFCSAAESDETVKRFFQIAETTTKGKFLDLKADEMAKVNQHELDTGTPEAQIASLTVRIDRLREHFQHHKKDFHSRRGMDSLVTRRRKVMQHLKRNSPERYKQCVDILGLDAKLVGSISVKPKG
uniref:30S ribosomal protein S15 n=1 Tax=Aplanochytrium stocchinoi TaxID=215587 RepID=A0A6S8F1X8_9STRA|mmetsp:Transcript_18899/g.23047  ORF Transcript_18899/g.23047 Transcript_18899/m.23047 type:complete len:160 (+) Transcript_18899:211-690(+)